MLNIAERRLPEDGRIKLWVKGKEIDLCVSTVPTIYGGSVAIRILDRSNIVFRLERLGFFGDTRNSLEKIVSKPY